MADTEVVFDERGLLIDGEPVPIIAGEFHFWRVNAVYWPRILDRFIEGGVTMVSTFVCWDAHEPEPHRFDFSGETNPSLDLAGFLDLCAAKGLRVLVRPGPIIDAYWPTRGPARDVAHLERFETEYRERTCEYLDHLAPVIVPRQATAGGNVVMICVDNEVYYPLVTVGTLDHRFKHDEIEIIYRRECVMTRYRTWLRNRFDSIDQLNDQCGTHFSDFAEIEDPDFRHDPHELTMLAFEHINDSVAENFAWLRDELRTRGVDLPMYCNLRAHTEFIDWHRVDGIIDSSGNQAFHIPQGAGIEVRERDQEYVIAWVHLLHRARTRFPWVAEHQTGHGFSVRSDPDFQILPPAQFRYYGQLGIALGERGAAVTMFVECDSWVFSAVTPLGEVRKSCFLAVTDHLRTFEHVRADERLADCALIWCQQDHQAYVASRHQTWLTLQEESRSLSDPRERPCWWAAFVALHDEDWDFDLVIPANEPVSAPSIWIYAGSELTGLDTLKRVAEHVRNGGTLIVASALPEGVHSGGVAADAHARQLVAELRGSDRVHFASPVVLSDVLERVGATRYSTSGTPGCRTYNYVANGERDLWVANSTNEAQDLSIELECLIEQAELKELTMHSELELHASAPPRGVGKVVQVALPPKTVRGFRFEYSVERRVDRPEPSAARVS